MNFLLNILQFILLDPKTSWRDAEARMLLHRFYLVNVGELGAEQLQPEWCLHNEAVCPMYRNVDF